MDVIIDVSSGDDEEEFEPLNVVFPDYDSVSSNKCKEIFPSSSSSDESLSMPSGLADFLFYRRNRKPVSVFLLSEMENVGWVSDVVKRYRSNFKTPESIEKWRRKNKVTYDFDESEIILEPCWEDDIVCFTRPVGMNPEFFFMYEYLFSDFHVFLPFTDFEEKVLRELNVAPTQLLPNSWGFIRGFEIVCAVLDLLPSVGVFFAFHIAKGCDKGGWVYISSKPQRAILSAYASNYKSWRNNFFRVRPHEEFPELLIDESGAYKFPIFWEEHPTPGFIEKTKLTEEEEVTVSVLEKLAPVSCKELIEDEFDSKKMEKLFLPLMPMKEKEILAYMKRIPAEKKAVAMQQSGQAKKRKNVTDDQQNTAKGKRQNVESSPKMTEFVNLEKGTSSWTPVTATSENEMPWKAAVRRVVDEFTAMEEQFGSLSLEYGKVKKSKDVLTNDVVNLRKELEKEQKKSMELQRRKNEEKEKFKNDLALEQGISNSLKSQLEEKDNEIEELKMEVALQRSLGFENAVDQIKCLHPEIDIAAISLWKVVVNGEIVDVEDSLEGEEENEGEDRSKENANIVNDQNETEKLLEKEV